MNSSDRFDGIAAFVETARYLSFTEAAIALGLTKSAVGKAVARLEARLGVTLIYRSTRRLVLSPEGLAYLSVARQVLDDLASSEATLQRDSRVISGKLRIDAPAAWGRLVLLPILAELALEYPDLHLFLSFNDRLVDPVEEGIDLAIRFGETSDIVGVTMRKLTEQRAPLVASPAYLERRGCPAAPEDLLDHACITGLHRDVPVGFRLMRPGQAPERLNIPSAHEIGDGTAVIDAAIAGLGIAQMPYSLVADALRQGRLVEILPDYATACVGVYALWPEKRQNLARVRLVIDTLVKKAQSDLI